MKRQRGIWLVLAALLFLVAAGLMGSGQGEEAAAPEAPPVEFPKKLRPAERERLERRRTYVLPNVGTAVTAASEPVTPRDPLLAALPRGTGKMAVVIEANAIRHSPIGEMLMECLLNQGGDRLRRFQETTGVDPFQDLDRLVLTDDGIIVSGNFGDPRLQQLLAAQGPVAYGKDASLFELTPGRTSSDGGVNPRQRLSMASWNQQLLMFGFKPNDMNALKDTIDRVEGRGPDEPPVLSEESTYGEMYGVLPVEQLRKLLPPDQQALADRLAQVAQNVELHVDATSDFAMTARVKGVDAALVTDLGKSLGGALSLARVRAQTEGETELAQLLDFARVRPDGATFNLEMAVPLEVIQKQLAFCREAQAPSAAPAP